MGGQTFSNGRGARSWSIWLAILVLLVSAGSPAAVFANEAERAFGATLSAKDRRTFESYTSAKAFHELMSDEYWADVEEKRKGRRAKRKSDTPMTSKDYVDRFPPTYSGPELPEALAKRWAAFLAQREKDGTAPPAPRPLPGLQDFLAHAKEQYGYVPERIDEREFKRRYAHEALRLGLTKEQVVRVYALETSGLGTADMVAGIHPITKKGKPISSAIGYAQLLAANTTSELVKHGADFIARLEAKADRAADERDRARLKQKAKILAKMLKSAKSIPNEWDNHVAWSKTARGLGIHAINLDGDIGPWLQVIKLDGLRELAAKKGRERLSGAEIELMNLAGPATGLEMMTDVGRRAPTPNFFARGAYWRNTIVRGKTAEELLVALDKRMDDNIKNQGAITFAEVFDEVARERQAAR
ncbi:MAG: hypothetical protein NW216_13290 [Hyphomicrobium sp.]|nr:hypothetical protein [Hyphomicrobium sp.]